MRQDWVEFLAGRRNKKFCVRPEYIIAFDEAVQEDEVILYGEAGDKIIEYSTCEPYEQVKQKIIDAEKVGLSDVAVEHFTRDEYDRLRSCVLYYQENSTWYVDHKDTQRETDLLLNKLNKILKEGE